MVSCVWSIGGRASAHVCFLHWQLECHNLTMPTNVGTGRSSVRDTQLAVSDALGEAVERKPGGAGASPTLGFLFVGPPHDPAVAVASAHKRWGACEWAVCSTAGEFTERGLTHHGIAVLLVLSDAL